MLKIKAALNKNQLVTTKSLKALKIMSKANLSCQTLSSVSKPQWERVSYFLIESSFNEQDMQWHRRKIKGLLALFSYRAL